MKKDAWAFTLGGSIYGWEAVGIARTPSLSAPNAPSNAFHVPAVIQGRQPFGPNNGGSLFVQYGNSVVSATVNVPFSATGKEQQGFYNAASGPSMSAAYLTVNPPPFGTLTLQLRVGAFTEAFAGPGQWGWGLFGPMLATRGYGFSAVSQYPISDSLLMNSEIGFQAVPGVPENFVRGEYTGWLETGINSMVAHAHWGLVYKNQYTARLHYAHAWGFDERKYLETQPKDGSIDTALLETRYVASPFGQLGMTFAFWNFKNANHVHDAIWWGLDYTKGGADMLSRYLGLGGAPNGQCNPIADANGVVIGQPFDCTGDPAVDGTPVQQDNGTGKLFAISAEWDTSIAQLLWHPRPFNGQGPDLRVAAAATVHWTLDTGDPAFKGASGFLGGLQLEYQMLSWFSTPLRIYGEDRDFQYGRYRVYSISPGVAFRTNWQSTDRIELIYSRRFYSSAVDDNPARPLDRNVVALGAYINF